ncbi:MAG: hypothetical protein ACI9FB_003492, partial [Candidatus Azotimanducaceae bacterium]
SLFVTTSVGSAVQRDIPIGRNSLIDRRSGSNGFYIADSDSPDVKSV